MPIRYIMAIFPNISLILKKVYKINHLFSSIVYVGNIKIFTNFGGYKKITSIPRGYKDYIISVFME